MYTIYLITNLVNGKVYVGQTEQGLQERWRRHINQDRRPGAKHPIKSAIHKYGSHNFTVHKIDSAETHEQANFLEMTWIYLYNSRQKQVGYNIKSGGTKGPMDAGTKRKISEANKRVYAEGKRTFSGYLPPPRRGKDNSNFRADLPCSEYLVFLCNSGVSATRMAEFFKTTINTIFNKMKATELPRVTHTSNSSSPTGHHTRYVQIDEKRLRQYCQQGLSSPKIGAIFGCSYALILRRMKTLGLTRNKENK